LANGGDGLGPVFNASSCVACHNQGGPGGGGGLKQNVTMFTVRSQVDASKPVTGVVHSHATKFQENLQQVHPELPPVAQPALADILSAPGSTTQRIPFPGGVPISQRNTPALFGDRLIDELPDRVLLAQQRSEQLRWGMAPGDSDEAPVGRVSRLADGRIGRFGWKAQTATLLDFVEAACANELGLGNPGQGQPRPLTRPDYLPTRLDLTTEQCQQISAFVGPLPQPSDRVDDAMPDHAP